MLDNGRSADQIRSTAGVSFADAQVASYMASGAASGWSLADFVAKTRIPVGKARAFAFQFGVKFPDYDPEGATKNLSWCKAKVGWELRNGSDVIGTCLRQEDKRYLAQALGKSIAMSDARVAMGKLSAELDAASADLFGGKPLKVFLRDADGKVEDVLFGLEDETTKRCRTALAFDCAA